MKKYVDIKVRYAQFTRVKLNTRSVCYCLNYNRRIHLEGMTQC